ncbi:hypothetical protein [Streptomyces sp. NPDC058424]|uniref:hypothetical protein n=1 Tax=Streptomyces sp. NPDC058424 TaxID=3346491 RepID=UPI003659E8DC
MSEPAVAVLQHIEHRPRQRPIRTGDLPLPHLLRIPAALEELLAPALLFVVRHRPLFP